MINVTKTYLPDPDKYKSYVDRIFSSCWVTNNGQFVQELEKRLCDYLGVENLLLISNGTLALQVAYKALGINNEVTTTPFSFVATTSSMVWEGILPVFSDIDPSTLNLDPEEIINNITPLTSAIVPVHVFGNACNIEEISQIAKKHKLKTIYDAAHAFGVTYNGKSILNYGDASILSFHGTKVFHTIEGGAIVFKEKKHLDAARLMINFGIPGYDQIATLGINCKMNEFQAAMGLCVLDDMEFILRCRKKVWEKYTDSFINEETIQLQKQNTSSSMNYSYFPVILKSEEILLRIKDALFEKGIAPRRYFYPSLEQVPYIKPGQQAPISSSVSKRILCLPIYPDLESEDQDTIIETLLKIAKENG
jgi:dTDP-4-amino-4,6-dideoxygalactose transaminase